MSYFAEYPTQAEAEAVAQALNATAPIGERYLVQPYRRKPSPDLFYMLNRWQGARYCGLVSSEAVQGLEPHKPIAHAFADLVRNVRGSHGALDHETTDAES